MYRRRDHSHTSAWCPCPCPARTSRGHLALRPWELKTAQAFVFAAGARGFSAGNAVAVGHLLLPEPWDRACLAKRFKRAQRALPRDVVSRVWALRRMDPEADIKVIDTPKLSPFLSSHSVALPPLQQRSGVEGRSHPTPIPELTPEPSGASICELPKLWVH